MNRAIVEGQSQQQPQSNPAELDKATETGRRDTQKIPFVVEVAPTEADRNKAKQQEERERHKALVDDIMTGATVAIAVFTGALAAGTVFLACYTFRLWKETKRLGKDAKTSADDQLRHLKDTSKLELRAYLGVNGGRVDILDNGKLRALIDMPNKGRTPAHNTTRYIAMDVLPLDHSDFPEAPHDPGSWVIVPDALWTIDAEIEVDEKQRAAIAMGDLTVFVWGKVLYYDIYDRQTPKETHFRYRLWLENHVSLAYTPSAGLVRQHVGWGLNATPEGNRST